MINSVNHLFSPQTPQSLLLTIKWVPALKCAIEKVKFSSAHSPSRLTIAYAIMPVGAAAGKPTADGACSKTQRDDHFSIIRTLASSEVLVQHRAHTVALSCHTDPSHIYY